MSILQIEEGESAILECRLAGNPKPALQWLKGGKVIKNSTNYVYLQDLNDSYKLIIRVNLFRSFFFYFWTVYIYIKRLQTQKGSKR